MITSLILPYRQATIENVASLYKGTVETVKAEYADRMNILPFPEYANGSEQTICLLLTEIERLKKETTYA